MRKMPNYRAQLEHGSNSELRLDVFDEQDNAYLVDHHTTNFVEGTFIIYVYFHSNTPADPSNVYRVETMSHAQSGNSNYRFQLVNRTNNYSLEGEERPNGQISHPRMPILGLKG